jgi:hypothetical protein
MAQGSYSWLTLSTAIAQLAQRLNDPANQFWSQQELSIYISTALKMFNSLTWTWRRDFQFVNSSNPPNVWTQLGSLAGSPRLRTTTDTEVYTELELMLLEPPSGGTWTGTTQFQITDLSQALQRRRDEILQISNCNQSLMTGIPLTPNTIRTLLPDTVIDVERVRYLFKVSGMQFGYGQGPFGGPPGFGGGGTITNVAVTLSRDDTVAQEFYQPPLYELPAGIPNTFSLSSEPPLSWDVDIPPVLPGTYEAVVLQSGAPFNPPTPTLVGIPQDFIYVCEFGALADLLGREPESTDRERAVYCAQRYLDGLKLMSKTPWIELGKINGQAVSIDSIYSLDRYSPNWDSDPTGFGPVIVAGGVDFIASPVNSSTGCTLLANAPVPSVGTDYVQVSRSNWETVILLAQSRACWKLGGGEWKASLDLEKEAILACANENNRLKSLGAYSDILDQRGLQQERDMNRFNSANAGKS